MGIPGLVAAQVSYEIGSNLSPSQVSALGDLKTFRVANKTFRILPSTNGSNGYVINDQGKVGKCDGEVLLSGLQTDRAKRAFDKYQSQIVSIKVYESLKMVSAKFANVIDAAEARNDLSSSLPEANVTLPITFSFPKAQ